MAGKGMESDLYGTTFSTESIKVIAESIGIGNLPDDAARELSEDISFRIKHIIQDAAKYMHHAKRTKILASDIDSALKARNLEPQYGFYATEPLPFRFASGGGRELHFIEEKEVDLNELVQNANTKAPLEVTLRSHWLCIDGIQPTIPENPPPLSKESQKLDSVDPVNKLNKPTLESAGKPTLSKQKLRNVETVQIKQLATHELSVEQQIYYKEITEACVGSDEGRRTEALQSLSSDPGLHEMLPRMCTFIIEGVRVNVVQNNLALLIYLMRMVKALLDNQALFLEKYLHELIPSVTTCIVSRQLCMRPELDNHWALRDFASRLMAQICKNFNTSTNNIQTRVTRMFSNALAQGDKLPLSSLYGALEGLSELGTEVIKTFILPRIRAIGDRIMQHLDGPQVSNIDKNASNHIKSLLLKVLAPVIKTIKTPPDYLEEYRNDFGYLGPALQSAVLRARAPPPTSTQNVSVVAGLGCGGAGNVGAGIVGMGGGGPGRVIGVTSGTSSQQQTTILQQTSQQAGRTIMVNQPGGGTRVQTVGSSQVAAGNPKILFLTQRSNPGNQQQQQQQQLPQQPQMVKFVPGTAGVGTSQQTKLISTTATAAAGGSSSGVVGGSVSSIATGLQQHQHQQQQQKLMVVSVANTAPGSAVTNAGSNVVINTQPQQQSQQQQVVATELPPVTVLAKSIFQTKHFPEPQVDDLSHLA